MYRFGVVEGVLEYHVAYDWTNVRMLVFIDECKI